MDELGEPPSGPDEDEDIEVEVTPLGILLAIPVLLWAYKRAIFGFLVVALIALAKFGVFNEDKKPIAELHSCPGYEFVRDLKVKGQINTFKAVKPEKGWKCEYSLDNEDAEVRFRGTRGELKTEVDGYVSTPAYSASVRQMHAEGFHDVP